MSDKTTEISPECHKRKCFGQKTTISDCNLCEISYLKYAHNMILPQYLRTYEIPVFFFAPRQKIDETENTTAI